MYPLISVFIIVVGALLLVFANKIIKNNKVNRIGIKVVGGILIIVGLLLLYFLLSRKIDIAIILVSEIPVCQADTEAAAAARLSRRGGSTPPYALL